MSGRSNINNGVNIDGDLDELLDIVAVNKDVYRVIFSRFLADDRFSVVWNWYAFLLPLPWLLYRKLYIATAVFVLSGILVPVVGYFLMAAILGAGANYYYFQHIKKQAAWLRHLHTVDAYKKARVYLSGTHDKLFTTVASVCVFSMMMEVGLALWSQDRTTIEIEASERVVSEPGPQNKDLGNMDPAMLHLLTLREVINTKIVREQRRNPGYFVPNSKQDIVFDLNIPRFKLVDFWGTPIEYKVEPLGYELWSAGPDREFETQDDIYLKSIFNS